jgi:hypothetical protein
MKLRSGSRPVTAGNCLSCLYDRDALAAYVRAWRVSVA